MIINPSFEADKLCNPKSILNAKKLVYFKASAGFRVALSYPALIKQEHTAITK
jgi:hypothetical protein